MGNWAQWAQSTASGVQRSLAFAPMLCVMMIGPPLRTALKHSTGEDRKGQDVFGLSCYGATSPETGLTLLCSTHLSWILGFIFLVKDCNCQGHEKYLPLAHL